MPPTDDFAASQDLVILEGPVWVNGVLYLSQINSGPPFFGFPGGFPGQPGATDTTDTTTAPQEPPAPPPSRVLALHGDGRVSILAPEGGSNGLAVDASGRVLTANHLVGGITELSLNGGSQTTLVNQYAGVRFNSPNDITVGRDGTIYFTDPDYQAPVPAPQSETRAYRLPPGATEALPIVEGRRQPNGITLSPTGETLYISAQDGILAYPVQSDGSLGQGQPFAQGVVSTSDGMAVDCAGNLYTTNNQSVTIVNPQGVEVGRINVSNVQSVTNVAFGGDDSKTIFITSLGTSGRAGLYQVKAEIPGMPY
jgi:gluconolactonase